MFIERCMGGLGNVLVLIDGVLRNGAVGIMKRKR